MKIHETWLSKFLKMNEVEWSERKKFLSCLFVRENMEGRVEWSGRKEFLSCLFVRENMEG